MLAGVAWMARAQVDSLRFEVASVKAVVRPGRAAGGIGALPGGERFKASSATLRGLVSAAYRVNWQFVSGGPSWLDREFFDVDAKADRPSTGDEMRAMLRNLLADRFSLLVRREHKEMPVYALMADAGGTKLAQAAETAEGDPAIDQSTDPWPAHRMKWKCKSWPMDFLAFRLANFVDRPVINSTALEGRYDFELSFVEDVDPAIVDRLNATGRFNPHPPVFEALRQQLGLRLDPARGPVETIVVERAERPAAN